YLHQAKELAQVGSALYGVWQGCEEGFSKLTTPLAPGNSTTFCVAGPTDPSGLEPPQTIPLAGPDGQPYDGPPISPAPPISHGTPLPLTPPRTGPYPYNRLYGDFDSGIGLLPKRDIFGNVRPRIQPTVINLAITIDGYSKRPLTGPYGLPECAAPEVAERYNDVMFEHRYAVPHNPGPGDPRWSRFISLLNGRKNTQIRMVIFNGHGSSGQYGPMNTMTLGNRNSLGYRLLIALRNRGVSDIRFRACNITKTQGGRDFIQMVANITGATVSGYRGDYIVFGWGENDIANPQWPQYFEHGK
ncbi:MAG: DUF4347 domain-containing protein, partial [Planctomycetaceae bacterium]|nr:DUF4347 domain-containing protein [Planctomycetaceae bacterium]